MSTKGLQQQKQQQLQLKQPHSDLLSPLSPDHKHPSPPATLRTSICTEDSDTQEQLTRVQLLLQQKRPKYTTHFRRHKVGVPRFDNKVAVRLDDKVAMRLDDERGGIRGLDDEVVVRLGEIKRLDDMVVVRLGEIERLDDEVVVRLNDEASDSSRRWAHSSCHVNMRPPETWDVHMNKRMQVALKVPGHMEPHALPAGSVPRLASLLQSK
eukprot:scaffold59792_cov19-Tisochrysis_lutea.AAC.1